MKTVLLNKKSYPVAVTMGALLEFQELTGSDLGQIGTADYKQLITYFYCVVKSACRRDKLEFPFEDVQAFADALDMAEFSAWSQAIAKEKAESEGTPSKKK